MSPTSQGGSGPTSTGQSSTGSAMDKAGAISRQASMQAADVGDTAAEQAKKVGQEALVQAQSLLDQSKEQLRQQANSQTQQLADAVERLGDQIRALLDGEPEQAGSLVTQAETAVAKLETLAEGIRLRGLDGAVAELDRFGRRRPGLFLLGAALLGVGVGRMVRAGALQQAGVSTTDRQPIAYAPISASSEQVWDEPTQVMTATTVEVPAPPVSEPGWSAQ